VIKGDVWRFRVRHLAFPGAEGYGRFARGGRGGRVIKVTNLNDSGPGSLRAAVEVDGPRNIVFDVSGRIVLNSKLVIRNPYLTIAGQTAPGKGICISNYNLGMLGTHDVVIRYIRVRPGDTAGVTLDGMGMASSDHAIIDHCSISWTQDEAFSSRAAKNITLQRTLISEALNVAGHKNYERGKQHGYAASIGGDIGSFHHNLLVHCAGRNWSLAGGLDKAGRHTGRLDIRNNVVYNWGHRTTDGGAMQVNFVNNYYKPGPASRVFHVLMPERNRHFGPQDYFVVGNVMEGRYGANAPLAGVVAPRDEPREDFLVDAPFFQPYVTTQSAEETFENVLSDVGCNLPRLDDHDRRIIEETRSGTTTFKGSVTGFPGLPDSQNDVGGWEDYPEVRRPANWDTDHDGMPNEWESQHGHDPNDAADGPLDPDGDGYTNLEDYLNSIVAAPKLDEWIVLDTIELAQSVASFNAADSVGHEGVVPNVDALKWMSANVPRFDCPDKRIETTYYFRWWTFRKHIKQTPHGLVLTEFLQPVSHAGPYNTVSCAFGHHLAEGRWLCDQRPLDEYARFWFLSGSDRGPAEHFHKYSSWAAAALYNRYLVTLDREFLIDLLDNLVADYERWEMERRRSDGLFWQYDVADGMEESISGSRTKKNIRPTINSYMAANARAIAHIATLAGRVEMARKFNDKHELLRSKMIDALWDDDARFFQVRLEDGELSDAREAIGFIPWMFSLARPEHAEAWAQLVEPAGFWAPRGLTTAERRHPDFRSHGVGTCEWDGAVWPFATSQTLTGLANLLRGPDQPYVTRRDYFLALRTYAAAHQMNGRPYIGEYHDEITGDWLITGAKAARSRDYNHSTFCDLVISGLVGVVPRADDVVEINPLVPDDTWDWFCLDGVPYHGQSLTIIWDRTGEHYGRGAGLSIWADGHEIARSTSLRRLTGSLPVAAAAIRSPEFG
jgi:hypothetical protein